MVKRIKASFSFSFSSSGPRGPDKLWHKILLRVLAASLAVAVTVATAALLLRLGFDPSYIIPGPQQPAPIHSNNQQIL